MESLKAGDVVVADFPGIHETKRRPAIVLSTDIYHLHRPDLILGAVTTNLAVSTTPTDCYLTDWDSAGLAEPSAFRAFILTLPRDNVLGYLGHLSARDWAAVVICVLQAIRTS